MLNETSRDVVLVMNSIAVTTVVTWVKFERSKGQKVLPQTGCGHKDFPFLLLRVVRLGFKPNQCSATTAIA
jgi:hypothetical protein